MRHKLMVIGILLLVGILEAEAASRSECHKMAGDLKGEARKEFVQRCTNPESLSDTGKPKRDVQDGYSWASMGPAERAYVARVATQSLGGTYSPVEMVACLQTFYRRPAPTHLMRQEIAAVAIGCHAQLR